MSMQMLLRLAERWTLFAAPAYGRSKQLGRLPSAQHERQGAKPTTAGRAFGG